MIPLPEESELLRHRRPRSATPLGPGIHRLCFSDSTGDLVLKWQADADPGQVAAEASGLAFLSTHGAPTPTVIEAGERHLLIEWIGGSPAAGHWPEQLATVLAELHGHRGTAFGYDGPSWCGPTRQDNTWTTDGHRFHAERRLLPLGRRCRDRGLLDAAQLRSLERLCNALPRLLPAAPPVPTHGDLWSGNVLAATTGGPVLIDPAVAWAWAESDLGMLRLFGGVPERTFDLYVERTGLDAGWRARSELHQLFHRLNHLMLFGAGYLPGVLATLRRYA